jgi:uncharacterized membrane protein YgcG
VVLSGGAIVSGGTAAADPSQDEQFLALLDEEEIPALQNVSSLIATAHKVCRKLDGGMTVDALVDDMRNKSFTDPTGQQFPARRITATITRFITAAVEAYCPDDQSKIASIMANPAPGSNELMHRIAAYTHNAVNSGSDLLEPRRALDMINIPVAWQEPTVVRLPHLMGGGVFVARRYGDDGSDCDAYGTVLASLIGAVPSGEVTPDPPQIPAPPPPTAQMRTPPRPIAAPPPPKQSPPPAKQAEPPAVAPQPGGAAGSGGSGGNGGGGTGGSGGGGPAEPSPTPPMPPGLVRLAP